MENEEVNKLLELGKNIKLNPIMSSNISGIGYDESNRLLSVMFKGGSKYLYENVEKEVFTAICNSESVGRALNECVVKNKEKYKYHKLV